MNRTRVLKTAMIAASLMATAAHADGMPKAATDTDITIKACLGAVEAQTGRKALTVLGKDYSEANSAVMIGVGPEQAPWRCLVSNEGVVAELAFAGDASAP